MEARQHPPVALGIEQGEREALVAAGVLEGIEADEADLLECPHGARFETVGPRPESIDLAAELVDAVEVDTEHVAQVAVLASGQTDDPFSQLVELPRQPQHEDQEDDHGRDEHDDDGPDVGGHGRVQIDGRVLRRGSARV